MSIRTPEDYIQAGIRSISSEAPAPQQTIPSQVHSALSDASDLADQVCRIVDTLIGASPEEAAQKEIPTNGSVFGDLLAHSEATAKAVQRARSYLQRMHGRVI